MHSFFLPVVLSTKQVYGFQAYLRKGVTFSKTFSSLKFLRVCAGKGGEIGAGAFRIEEYESVLPQ